MNKAYINKRLFWYNLKNFDKAGIKSFGIDEILIAGAEFNMCDSCGHFRNLFIAANSQGDSGFYYEKDSKAGIGQITCEHSPMFGHIIHNFLNEAADLTYNMDHYKTLPNPPRLNCINFFALGRKGNFYKKLTLFNYLKHLLSEMRKTEILCLQNQSLKTKCRFKIPV